MKSFNIAEISQLLNGKLIGNSSLIITEPENLDTAKSSSISLIGDKTYLKKWKNSEARAAILQEGLINDIAPEADEAFIVVRNADLAMAKLLEMFALDPIELSKGIHQSAVVSESAKIGENTQIGANCYIGSNVRIGSNTIVYPNTTILDHAEIGNHTTIKSGTVISEKCIIGDHCIIHSNVNIGTDGFGYRPSDDGQSIVKIPHIGNVEIGHYVEIGAGTCIDRAKFNSTSVGDHTKIDNLVQIGHNCKIGRGCLIAGCCGISGSVIIEDGVTMAGFVSIKDHVKVGKGAVIGGKSGVIKNIAAGQTVLGFPATEAKKTLLKWAILNRMVKKELSKNK